MFNKIASRNLGREIAEEVIEKTALETGRSRYPEYDQSSNVAKRMGKYVVPATVAGAGIGAARGGGIGAINGGAAGMIAGTVGAALHQTIRDSKAATKRYDNSKDIRTAQMWGPGVADKRIARREIAEDLTEKEASTRWARELGKSVDEAVHATPSSIAQRDAAQRANKIMKNVSPYDKHILSKIKPGGAGKEGAIENESILRVRPAEPYQVKNRLQSDRLQYLLKEQQDRNTKRSSGNPLSILNSYR